MYTAAALLKIPRNTVHRWSTRSLMLKPGVQNREEAVKEEAEEDVNAAAAAASFSHCDRTAASTSRLCKFINYFRCKPSQSRIDKGTPLLIKRGGVPITSADIRRIPHGVRGDRAKCAYIPCSRDIVPYKTRICVSCGKKYCLMHKFPEDHECTMPAAKEKPPVDPVYEITNRQFFVAKRTPRPPKRMSTFYERINESEENDGDEAAAAVAEVVMPVAGPSGTASGRIEEEIDALMAKLTLNDDENEHLI